MNKQTVLTKGNPSEEFCFLWLLLSEVNSVVRHSEWFMPMIPAVGRQESQGQCYPRLGSEPLKPIDPTETEKLGDQSVSVSLSV